MQRNYERDYDSDRSNTPSPELTIVLIGSVGEVKNFYLSLGLQMSEVGVANQIASTSIERNDTTGVSRILYLRGFVFDTNDTNNNTKTNLLENAHLIVFLSSTHKNTNIQKIVDNNRKLTLDLDPSQNQSNPKNYLDVFISTVETNNIGESLAIKDTKYLNWLEGELSNPYWNNASLGIFGMNKTMPKNIALLKQAMEGRKKINNDTALVNTIKTILDGIEDKKRDPLVKKLYDEARKKIPRLSLQDPHQKFEFN